MKNLKKITALGLSAAMVMSMVPATLASADEETGKVYYLNFKPEQATQWEDLAAGTGDCAVSWTKKVRASGTEYPDDRRCHARERLSDDYHCGGLVSPL